MQSPLITSLKTLFCATICLSAAMASAEPCTHGVWGVDDQIGAQIA